VTPRYRTRAFGPGMAPGRRALPPGAAALLLALGPLPPSAEALTLAEPPPPREAPERRSGLPHHLESLRRRPLGERSDARAHLRRGLQAAWHIGNHFGHRWSGPAAAAAGALASVPQRAAGGDGSCGLPGGRRLRPADYGADPTGKDDSTEAMAKAMKALLETSASTEVNMSSNIRNLGGATLDLDGGIYLISQPVVIPAFVGNVGISGGTLRASERFPGGRWLLEIGDPGCQAKLPSGKKDEQGCCNEFVKVEDVLFDASHVASGGVRVANAMGATIGPSVFFTGFRSAGARVDGGHEVMIQQAWFAEWHDAREVTDQTRKSSESVGVVLNGQDHVLTDVIVFNFAHVGVQVNHAANILQNVHAWNGEGTGILLSEKAKSTRLLGCYLDGSQLVIHDPTQTVVESTFFLGAHVTLRASAPSKKAIQGLRFRGNTYASDGKSVPASIVLDGLTGGEVDVQDELTGDTQLRLTTARRSLHQEGATRWLFDFSDVLLLPEIDEVVYSFVSDGAADFVRHLARRPSGRTVAIETEAPTSGTVTVQVTQGKRGGGALKEPRGA